MPTLEEATMTRVTSRDGTEIAYWSSGRGRPLVLVHGTTSVHDTWRFLLPHLEPHVTVHAMDRRGRGASGDGADYAVTREYEDVAAVVDAVAEKAGCSVDLLGHSFGGECAFGAAGLTRNIRRLVLYEGWPPSNPAAFSPPDDVVARIETAIAADDREAALETMFRDVVMMSEDEIAGLRAGPTWSVRVAAAHTIPRELRAFAADRLDAARAASIVVPVLMLVGENSPELMTTDHETVAAALPDARVDVLAGQQHMAHLLDPEQLAAKILSFLLDD